MTMTEYFKKGKDPDDTEDFTFIFCAKDGTNSTASGGGWLAGETISSYTLTVDSGTVTVDSDNQNAVTIDGVSYSADTVVTMRVSGGVDGEDAYVRCRVTTSSSRIVDQTGIIKVRAA